MLSIDSSFVGRVRTVMLIMVEIFSSYRFLKPDHFLPLCPNLCPLYRSAMWRCLGHNKKVDYVGMLRSPYHLVSVLRVKRGADKGESFTDRCLGQHIKKRTPEGLDDKDEQIQYFLAV